MESKQMIKEVMALWKDAMTSFSAGEFTRCLEQYDQIEDKSGRIYYNMGCANIKLKQNTEAIQYFTKAVEKDPHSAISYFQRGVLYLNAKSLDPALYDFERARNLLRGNTFINYKQLGMLCKLHLCEVLYNTALVYIYKGDNSKAEKLLLECQYETEYKHRKQISETQNYLKGTGTEVYQPTPMKISADLTFTPPKDVIENLSKKNLMGRAKVISSTDQNDSDPTFKGPQRVEELKLAAEKKKLCVQAATSPLMAIKRFLKNPAAKRDRSKSQGVLNGQPCMKGSQSMMDLHVQGKSVGPLSSSFSNFTILKKKNGSTLDVHESATAKQLQRHSAEAYRRDRQVSLGTIFGNSTSPVSLALTKSFDVLSAVAAPVSPEGDRGFSPIGLDHEHFSVTSSDDSSDQFDEDVTDVFIDFTNHGEPRFERQETGTHDLRESDQKDCSFHIADPEENTSPTSDKNIQVEFDNKTGDQDTKEGSHDEHNSGGESPRRRKIPPPPSYPPPPLPGDFIIMV